MISGGAHSMIHPLGVMGFNRLTALSTKNDSPQTASGRSPPAVTVSSSAKAAAIVILESLKFGKETRR